MHRFHFKFLESVPLSDVVHREMELVKLYQVTVVKCDSTSYGPDSKIRFVREEAHDLCGKNVQRGFDFEILSTLQNRYHIAVQLVMISAQKISSL